MNLSTLKYEGKEVVGQIVDEVFRSLKRRLLVTEENGEWRLRVPLMRLWLRERG